MSSTTKKRKLIIIDSDDDDNEVIALNNDSDEDVKPKKKRELQKGKKRVIDSDEDGNSDGDGAISINDIKKKAKSRAKKLTKGGAFSDEEGKSTKSSSNKTPPTPKQKNNILNYFRPAAKKDDINMSKVESGKAFTQLKEKNEKIDISDEFMTTTISKGQKPIIKVDTSSNSVSRPNADKSSKTSVKSNKDESKSSKVSKIIVESPEEKFNIKTKVSSKVKQVVETQKSKPVSTKSPLKEVPKAVEPKKSPQKVSTNPAKRELVKSPKRPQPEALPRIVEAKRLSDLWVDKYKPQSTKAVIGQQGDRSPLNKLIGWLRKWHQNLDKKPGFGKWASDDGAGFRCALLSGPPGIGKTTTAQLVCKELGYDFLELNASDARNKKSLHEDVRELLENTKLTNFFRPTAEKPGSSTDSKLTAKHCVIMDEVDGMAGNEDRGGVAELILLIKKTKVPIICICNDRGNPKMRSLVNYCFDLRFPKPRIDQIKGALMSIAFKEQIKITPKVFEDLIASSNYDIRQCIHNLSMLGAGHSNVQNMTYSNANAKPIKDVKLGPFDAIKKVFCTGQEYAQMSFADKSDLFFADYGIMPLFVYENYSTINLASKEPSIAKQLKRLAKAIDCISYGELIEKEIRTNQNWSLLPLDAAFSTVMPGAYMRSANGLGFPSFPQYMGKLSTTNKNHRLIDELVSHMTLNVTGTRTSFPLDYLQPLKDSLIKPLVETDKAGVSSVLDLMEAYSITKDNMDSILELSLWSGDEDPMKKVDSKTKAALTRAYNKKGFALPYVTDNDTKMVTKRGAKGKKGKSKAEFIDADGEESDEVAADDDDEEQLMDFY